MKLESIVDILVHRDGMLRDDAENELAEMRERVAQGEDPEEVLFEIGLEPDYIFELLEY